MRMCLYLAWFEGRSDTQFFSSSVSACRYNGGPHCKPPPSWITSLQHRRHAMEGGGQEGGVVQGALVLPRSSRSSGDTKKSQILWWLCGYVLKVGTGMLWCAIEEGVRNTLACDSCDWPRLQHYSFTHSGYPPAGKKIFRFFFFLWIF